MKQAYTCASIIAHIYRTYSKIYIKIEKMNPFSPFFPNKKSLCNLAQRFLAIYQPASLPFMTSIAFKSCTSCAPSTCGSTRTSGSMPVPSMLLPDGV